MKAHITKLSHEGRGIAEIEGKTVFLTGGLPDETVEFAYTRKKSRYSEGQVTEVLNASPDRVTPKCPYTDFCGGCSLQHLSDAAQVEHKQTVLLEHLEHIGGVIPQAILSPITDTVWHYRRKARLGVRFVRKKNKMLVGFREKNGRFLTDMDSCVVLDKRVGLKIDVLADLIADLDSFMEIPQIEVAAGDDAVGLVFRHLVSLSERDKEKLSAFGEQHGFWIYLQPNPPEEVQLLFPQQDSMYLSYRLPSYQQELFFFPTDFTQVNAGINQKMIEKALKLLALEKDETVLDLFCGLGNFSLPLAKYAHTVTAVEGSQAMVKRGEFNATYHHINNLHFHCANLEDENLDAPWAKQTYDKILLDPPRTGALNVVKQIARWQPKLIVYISCNSATLARDAQELIQQSYQLENAGLINMFPHTKHAECIALFRTKNGKTTNNTAHIR